MVKFILNMTLLVKSVSTKTNTEKRYVTFRDKNEKQVIREKGKNVKIRDSKGKPLNDQAVMESMKKRLNAFDEAKRNI